MLPGILRNAHRIHDFATDMLGESGGTFEVKGPWFGDMDMVVTCDPANIHYILSKNFANYPKGPEFRKIFDILGDGIFNADSELWEFHRRTTLSIMSNAKFHTFLERVVWHKVEHGLIPVLDYFVERGIEVDLQDIFQRFTFDSICKLVLNYDPGSLSTDLPYIPCEKAFNDAVEALLHRHILPESIWKLQKWLGIGKEKKLIKAWEAFDQFLYPCILQHKVIEEQDDNFDFITAFRKACKETNVASGDSIEFLRDTFLNLMLAGRDTTSTSLTWLLWLISTNPSAETKILDEIEAKLHAKKDKKWRLFDIEESRKLVYLHGAICESLRLFPPVAFEHKAPVQADIIPSGHCIHQNKKVLLSFYSMGRMEKIWGKDCSEFKPERWISDERGGIKHEPSFKFPAFNAGPRTCLGKDMSFIQMKMVASTIIYNYHIQVGENHAVSPSDSIIIQMKHGLKVRFRRRKGHAAPEMALRAGGSVAGSDAACGLNGAAGGVSLQRQRRSRNHVTPGKVPSPLGGLAAAAARVETQAVAIFQFLEQGTSSGN
ncbi:Cytochrome [Abeliophyllum distichum]|uniref:Cytochrome n=1 Tax=Abeliophyllum distichum TaxID=126358 RepID=A0ABD1NSM6_9LAMI